MRSIIGLVPSDNVRSRDDVAFGRRVSNTSTKRRQPIKLIVNLMSGFWLLIVYPRKLVKYFY